MPRSLVLAFAAVLLASGAPAQEMDHTGHAAMAGGPAGAALAAANARMHAAMDIPPTGDADRDFAAAMIPHHQGAVEMARIELEHGTDPELRALAEGIIAAQEAEIAFLEQWLAEHP